MHNRFYDYKFDDLSTINYDRIKVEVVEIIKTEMVRIAANPNLKHLIVGEED